MTRSISVSMMIYVITGASIENAYPIYALQGYICEKQGSGWTNEFYVPIAISLIVDIEVTQAVLPYTVFD
ncbi:unnamed protein product [Musa acuminata subsp. malaccensis]|uniref:Uncharacterized protein n=1 Tax=Musa acuminata subsp. malaccensis TaxID=214687 RepID=A0A804U5P9_MUSAM|nr:unnamed protein product [Musa acuminata subsp. malaccensis]